jgi:hypothetical protein
MLIVLVTLPLIAFVARAGFALHRLWSTLPRSNRDFGLE